MNWKTENATRPDLAVLEVNPPTGFIGDRFYPVEVKQEKTGDTSYVTVTPDSAPASITDGTAPTTSYIGTSEKSWTMARRYKRYGVSKKEVYAMGGVAKADELGGKAAKRSIMRYIEGLQLTQLMSGATTPIYDGAIINTIQAGLEAIRLYPGKKVLACGFAAYKKLVNSAELVSRLSFNGWMGDTDSVLGLKPDVLKSMLSNVFGIDEVLIADDTLCPSGKIAVAALPELEELSYKLNPELGKTFVFIPDTGFQFDIESFCDENEVANKYDAECYNAIVEFNAGARFVMAWQDAAPSATPSAAPESASNPA